jgi:hypothetical protein
VLGSPQNSLYAALPHGGKWYLSGYPSATYEYNPAQPWTLTDTTTDHTATNPRRLPLQIGKYHYFSAAGSDGRVYVAANHERDSVGGELGWCDPADDATGSLREPLARWAPCGLAAVGTRIVYSGNSLDGEEGTLFVVSVSDPATIERTITPLTGLPYDEAGYIVRVSDTDVVGVAGFNAYRVNVVTGVRLWLVTLPEQAMGGFNTFNRRAELAPDGYIYFYGGTSVYRLNADTGTLRLVAENAGAQGLITWRGGTAYIYGTTELRRIRPADA